MAGSERNPDDAARKSKDLAAQRSGFLLVWGVPIAGLVVGGAMDLEALFWPPALFVMGAGCVINAFRCGRLHCFLTGPLFLLSALASLAFGLGWVDFGPDGWRWIGAVALVGGLGLTYGPEMIWGRYFRGWINGSAAAGRGGPGIRRARGLSV